MSSSIRLILLGNFFSSLAAGVVLARGLSLMREIPGFFGDSVITFLVGGLIAFGIVARLRSSRVTAAWPLSLLALVSSGVLWFLSKSGIDSAFAQVALFALMSVFFAMGLASRSLRSDLAASVYSKLPVAEVAYSAGYLVGLGLTTIKAVTTMEDAFLAAAISLVATTAVDFRSSAGSPNIDAVTSDLTGIPTLVPLSRGDWVLAIQFGILTIGVQIFLQRYSSWTDTTVPLAAFEVGVLVATVVATLAHPTLLTRNQDGGLGSARVLIESNKATFTTGWLFALTLTAPIAGVALDRLKMPAAAVAAIFLVGSFLYEYLSLALLQHIGRNQGNVAVVFAATAVISTLVYGASMFL